MIAPRLQQSLRSHRKMWWRVLWAVVLLCHAPATLNAFGALLRLEQGSTSNSSILLLVASNAFFILEILFACSLRLLSSRRNALVFVLIIVLLHVGVFESKLPHAMAGNQLTYCLLLTAIGAADWRRLLALAAMSLHRLASTLMPAPSCSRRSRHDPWDFPAPRDPDKSWNCSPLRAPPSLAC